MNIFRQIITLVMMLGVVACSNNSPAESKNDPAVASSVLVFTIQEKGGCIRMGPNCARYELASDGAFNVFRGDGLEVEATGNIPPKLKTEWLRVVSQTDFDQLRSQLKEGVCKACFDGVDHTYTITQAHGPEVLDSVTYAFDESLEFFAVSAKIYQAISANSDLEIQSR